MRKSNKHMMARSHLSFLLLAALVGIAAAFFRPAVPHQTKSCLSDNIGGGVETAKYGFKPSFVDAGLDNPLIENDDGIEASRKCGFCMGVSLKCCV